MRTHAPSVGLMTFMLLSGASASARLASPGDIVINEIMQDPSAVADGTGEWFELFNTTTAPIDIDGWILRDDDIDSHLIVNGGPLVVPPRGYVVLGPDPDPGVNGGVALDYAYGPGWSLDNDADEVVLLDTNLTEIDRVDYDGGPAFPDPTGAAMALRDTNLDNAIGANWCVAATAYGFGDLGTPHAANDCHVGMVPVELTIPEIQGPGTSSPFLGQLVRTTGFVVNLTTGGIAPEGFFIQDSDGDGDPSTSDGIYVFDPGGSPVSIGDLIQIEALATEHFGLTELHTVQNITSMGTGSVSPTPVSLPEAVEGDLERFEGMLIELVSPMTVSEATLLGRYGQLTLAGPDDLGTPGRLTQPTNAFNPGSNPVERDALADENRRRSIVLDDGNTAEYPDPVPYIGPPPALVLRAGDTVSGLVGCLDYGRVKPGDDGPFLRDYRLQPSAPPLFSNDNTRTVMPHDATGDVRVATFNVMGYFNGDGLGGGFPTPSGADTPSEFERQSDKLVEAILALEADVVGLVEIENDGYGATSAIAELVDRLNAVGGPWAYVAPEPAELEPGGLLGGEDTCVGLIYRPAQVTLASPARTLRSGAFDQTLPDGGLNRVPLVQTFTETATGETFTVVLTHFKSKEPDGSPSGPNLDSGDGQSYWNERRIQAGSDLVAWIATDPTGSGDADILIVGDLNSYAAEDPILAIDSAGYVDSLGLYVGSEGYSFVSDGQAGYLDHGLISPTMLTQVAGATEWHINADEPEVLSYDETFNPPGYYNPDPFRSSDHDPVLVGFDLGLRSDRDTDGDGEQDDRDCDPTDGESSHAPGGTRDLLIQKTAGAAVLSWLPPTDPGATAFDYRVLRSDSPTDFASATTCLSAAAPAASDSMDPDPGELFAYLVQTVNSCPDPLGYGDLGSTSAGTPRAGACAVDFTLATPAVPETPQACFNLGYPCIEPSEVSIWRTAPGTPQEVWAYRPGGGGYHSEMPSTQCVDTDGQAGGTYEYEVRVECDTQTVVATVENVLTIAEQQGVTHVSASQPVYQGGDEIVIYVESPRADLELEADFSDIPAGLMEGSPLVDNLGGGFYAVVGVTVPVQANGQPTSGIFTVAINHVETSGGVGPELKGRFELPIEIAPRGVADVQVAGAFYRYDALQPEDPLGFVQIVGVTPLGFIPPDNVPLPPVLSFDEPGAAPSIVSGMEVEVQVQVDPAITLERLVITTAAADGGYVMPLPDPGGTQPLIVPIVIVLESGASEVDLVLQAAGGGSASSPFMYNLDLSARPVLPTHRVRGRIRYEAERLVADLGTELDSSPQYYGAIDLDDRRPLRRALIWIQEGCGTLYKLYTKNDGRFDLSFATACPDEPATITAWAVREAAPEAVRVARWTGGPIDSHNQLTADPGDYSVYGYDLGTFTPAAGPVATGGQDLGWLTIPAALENQALLIMDTIARAMDHYGEWVNAAQFHDMNIEWDGNRAMDTDYSVYLLAKHPSFIHIQQHMGDSEFAAAHETGHYFHTQFVRAPIGYGRFGEPLANIHAAAILQSPWLMAFDTAESMDVNGHYRDGTFVHAEIDFELDCDNNDCSHSQGWDWRIYYDLLDGIGGEPLAVVEKPNGAIVPVFDGVDGGGPPGIPGEPDDDVIMDVLSRYLRKSPLNPAYGDRGQSGVDLVDVLDGMVCRGHITAATATNLLHSTMGYSYDFDPPSASCP